MPSNYADMRDLVTITAAAKSSLATDQTGPNSEPDGLKGPDSQRIVEKSSVIGDGIERVKQEVNIGRMEVQQMELVQHGEYSTEQLEDEKSHLTLPSKQVLLESSERKVQQHPGMPYARNTGWHAADTSSKDTNAEPNCHQMQDSQRSTVYQALNSNHVGVERGVRVTEQLVDTECIKVDEGDRLTSSHKQLLPASSTQKWDNNPATPYPQHTASPAAGALSVENSHDFLSIASPHHPVSQYLQPRTTRGDGEPGCEAAEMDQKSFSHAVNSLGCYQITLRRSDLTTLVLITAFTLCCCVECSVFILDITVRQLSH